MKADELKVWMDNQTPEQKLKELLKPHEDDQLRANTVKPLRGKNSPGNTPQAHSSHVYTELFEQPRLF
jgi:putative SOS response-associated peptidase YedK